MKIALLSLFFLLFAFCSKAQDVVLDVENNPVRPGKPYHIRDAANCEHAISLDEIRNQTCPISVVLAIDPKQVIFHTIKHPEAENITAKDHLEIEFSWVSECANPPNWRVQVDACAVYPLVVGPPDINRTPYHNLYHMLMAKTLGMRIYWLGCCISLSTPIVLRISTMGSFKEITLGSKSAQSW